MIRHKSYTEVKYKNHGENRIYLYKDGTLINQFPNIKYCHEYLIKIHGNLLYLRIDLLNFHLYINIFYFHDFYILFQ